MPQPLLIVITGQPCTGKSTLAQFLSQRLTLPRISKDGIKETLFDSLGYSNRAWSKQLGFASYALLYYFVELELAAGRSLIVESNFDAARAGPILQRLRSAYPFRFIQIICRTEPSILFERFAARALSSERHPGHVEADNLDGFRAALARETCQPLPLEGTLISLDTMVFDLVDYGDILQQIHTSLAEVGQTTEQSD